MPLRVALLATAGAGLFVGVWSGLVRAGWDLPVGGVIAPGTHGVVMVSGFFGSLISLERAVALDRNWPYLAPPAAALGALGLGAGMPGAAWWSLGAAIVMTLGSLVLWRKQPSVFMAIMAGGAAAWAVAIVVQMVDGSLERQVPWLAAFLVGTIVGERLELSRLAPPSAWKEPGLVLAMFVFAFGSLAASLGMATGWRIFGVGLLAIACWLAIFDVARRTVRIGGVTRFIAVCLLSGYVWLAIAGGWWLLGGDMVGTLDWDGALHAVFVGFVLSMVFGHVHMVAPAILGVAVPYRSWFVAHLVLLHLSLAIRLLGDIVGEAALRRWGSVGNAAAIGLFVGATLAATTRGRRVADRAAEGDRQPEQVTP